MPTLVYSVVPLAGSSTAREGTCSFTGRNWRARVGLRHAVATTSIERVARDEVGNRDTNAAGASVGHAGGIADGHASNTAGGNTAG